MSWLDSPARLRLRNALTVARWVYAPLVIVCLVYAAYRARDVVLPMLHDARPAPLVVAVALWAGLHLLTPVFSWLVLRDFGCGLPYAQVLRIHVARLPAKYLPGGIWHTVSRMADFHRAGIDRAPLARLALLESSLPIGASAMLGGGCLVASGEARLGTLALFGGTAWLLVLFVLSRHPRSPLAGMSLRGFAAVASSSLAFWAIASFAFDLYWSSYPSQSGDLLFLRVAGAYMLAWTVGFAAVFAPQGAGVFETVIGVLLKGAIPLMGTALIAAGFRVVVLAADLLALATLHLWNSGRRRRGTVIDHP